MTAPLAERRNHLRRQYGGHGDHLGIVDAVLNTLNHHHSRPAEPGSERAPDSPY